MTRTDRRLAWIILAILGCAAMLGFGRGLSQALNEAPTHRPSDGGATILGGEPRTATALPLIDEARVRQIAREEADAAVVRARPKRPPPPKPAEPDPSDAAAPSDPVGAVIAAPAAGTAGPTPN